MIWPRGGVGEPWDEIFSNGSRTQPHWIPTPIPYFQVGVQPLNLAGFGLSFAVWLIMMTSQSDCTLLEFSVFFRLFSAAGQHFTLTVPSKYAENRLVYTPKNADFQPKDDRRLHLDSKSPLYFGKSVSNSTKSLPKLRIVFKWKVYGQNFVIQEKWKFMNLCKTLTYG